MNRREFLSTSAAGLALTALGGYVAGAQDRKPLRVGLIGTGWYGKSDLLRLIQVAPVEVVSLCDVDKHMLEQAGEIVASRQASHKTPRLYHDYREMLKEKDLDIVEVATPDHWHALAMIAAVESGADVYVQKPISVDIAEGKAMLAAARKHGRVVQVGTQRRSTPHLVEAKKYIDDGRLGKIGYVETYCYYHHDNSNPPDEPPPAKLDYDLWTGPAPMRPFCRMTHPRGWRSFMEYGNGTVGDMGIHMVDMVRWMMGLGWPKSISSNGGIYVHKTGKANISDTQTATFAYEDLDIIWTHRHWGDNPNPKVFPWGATFYGTRGTLTANVMGYDFTSNGKTTHVDVTYELDKYPEDKTEKDLEKQCAPAIRHHMLNFLDAIASRGKPVADIEQGYMSTTSCILANLSMKLGGRELKWDAEKGRVDGDDEANGLLRRPYREPWVHPAAT